MRIQTLKKVIDIWIKNYMSESLDCERVPNYDLCHNKLLLEDCILWEYEIRWVRDSELPSDGLLKRVIGIKEYCNSNAELVFEIYTGKFTVDDKYTLRKLFDPETNYKARNRIKLRNQNNINLKISHVDITIIPESDLSIFSKYSFDELCRMLKDADAIIAEYEESQPPKYNMDSHLNLLSYTQTSKRDITLLFESTDDIAWRDNLFIGFKGESIDNERNYLFEVVKKSVNITDQYAFGRYIQYEASFTGFITPTEQEIINAKFGWVLDNKLIQQAIADSGLI